MIAKGSGLSLEDTNDKQMKVSDEASLRKFSNLMRSQCVHTIDLIEKFFPNPEIRYVMLLCVMSLWKASFKSSITTIFPF